MLYFPTNASYIINPVDNTKLPCYTFPRMQDTSSTQVVIPNYLVILSHQCKLHHHLSWYYQITLLYFPTNASYIINSGGNTKLPCYTLPPMQVTSSTWVVIPNYPVILSDWRSTTVSLETYPLYFLKSGSSQLINYMQEMLFLMQGLRARDKINQRTKIGNYKRTLLSSCLQFLLICLEKSFYY